jgi:hypothetical protein
VARVVALTCSEPPGEVTHWTGRAMAKVTARSLTTIQRVLKAHKLAPHRLRTFKKSNDLASTFTEAVTFTGTTGVLELAHSQTYSGTISGFSTTGGTSLDLADIAFVSSTKATFSGTSASGVLTVTDGTHTAHINLTGNYTASTFTASSDGNGGTIAGPHTAIA